MRARGCADHAPRDGAGQRSFSLRDGSALVKAGLIGDGGDGALGLPGDMLLGPVRARGTLRAVATAIWGLAPRRDRHCGGHLDFRGTWRAKDARVCSAPPPAFDLL